MLRNIVTFLAFCIPALCGATCADEGQGALRPRLYETDPPEMQAYFDTLSPEERAALTSMRESLQRIFLIPTTHEFYMRYTRPDRSLIIPIAGLPFHGDGEFMADVFDWYHPSVEEVAHIASLGFKPYQLPAALRLRALVSKDKAPHLVRLMPDNPFDAFLPLALSAGLPTEVLAQAASLPKEVQYGFLKDYPRPQAWYLSMLGVDPWVDYALLRPWFIGQMVSNHAPFEPDPIETVEALLVEGTSLKRLATFFLATYHNGRGTLRLRPHLDLAAPLSPFLPFVEEFLHKNNINHYVRATDLYRAMTDDTVCPLHGYFGFRRGGSIYILNATPCQAPLPFREIMGQTAGVTPETSL